MVATRAQRAQTKDEPAPPKRGALKEPARRGRKKAEPEEPAPEPKPARAAAPKKSAKAAAPAAKPAAPATRRTRAKDADAPAPEEPVEAPEAADEPEEQQEEPAPRAPARATKKAATTKATTKAATTKAAATKVAATKAAPKPAATTTRKRSAKDVDTEPAPPAKRQTRTRATAEPEEPAEDAAMEEPEEAPVAKRTTRATRGTKASETRSAAAVKPLAQRITVTAKKPAKKAKKEKQPEPEHEEANTADVEMEDAEEPTAPAPAKSTKKSSRKAAKESAESERESSEAPVEPTPAKSAKKTSKKPALEEVPEAPVQGTEMNDEPAPATPIKSVKKSKKAANKEEEHTVQAETVPEPAPATSTKPSEDVQESSATPDRRSPTPEPTEEEESKENIPPPATPGPAHYAEALPFAAIATPFFKFGQTPKTTSLQARTPGLNKSSLFHETPRKAPIVSPFKLAPMSAAKPAHQDGSVLNSPPKRAPIGTSMSGMTPMRASTAKPDFKSSMLHTPAKKGLMLPPSTAPVNKNGFQPVQAKSSLLQTCPRRIALPALPPKSSATSPTKPAEGNMGSSLLSATPRRVRIESPVKPAFGTSIHDFAEDGEEPKRWKTPVKTPARRFATPGMTPAKSLVDADAGSPTPVKQTPAGLKDVNSALKLLNEASPAMHPTTPTEQFMLNVIEKLDQSMSDESEEAQEVSRLNDEVEVARSAEQPEEQDEQDDITEGLDIQQSVCDEMEQCVSPADLVMSDNESPVETPAPQTPAAQKPAPQFSVPQTPAAQTSPFHIAIKESDEDVAMNEQPTAPEAPVQQLVFEEQQFDAQQNTVEEVAQPMVEMEVIAEEPSVLEQPVEEPEVAQSAAEIEFIETYEERAVEEHALYEPVAEPTPAVDQQTEEKPALEERTIEEHVFKEKIVEEQEVQAPVTIQVPERPSTPTADEQHIAALAREKAKTERRARHKRLSMAIELEGSIRKPRKSLAFIPSLTPAKSALRSPFKKPFGSPKKSVAWAAEAPVPRIIEEYRQPEVVQAAAEFEINIPRPDDQLLGGAVFFVDVCTAEGEDASDLFVPLLEEMGAKIVDSWTGVDAAVTHVLYKDGAVETLEKVAATNGTVKAVNIAWVLDCERFNKWVPEGDYLVDLAHLGSNSPARALTTLSANTTPARATPAKSAYGTPFALLHMTPKSKPSLSPFADINSATTPNKSPMENKENTTPVSQQQQQQPSLFKTPTKAAPAADMDFTPSTPYFMHAHNIIQKTCPPKQSNRGLFDQGAPGDAFAVTPFRQKMLLARRSLSPAAFGRAMEM